MAELIKFCTCHPCSRSHLLYPKRLVVITSISYSDVPFIACVISLPSIFAFQWDLSNFASESGLSCLTLFHMGEGGGADFTRLQIVFLITSVGMQQNHEI